MSTSKSENISFEKVKANIMVEIFNYIEIELENEKHFFMKKINVRK